ncbi:AAA family ATPase [Capillimicrobium parvum]|nr:AAA family ATPase [Capillimicrobium parvum]
MDPTIAAQLRARLDVSELDADAKAVISAAIGDGDALPAAAKTVAGVYLKSISVRGFRGIGPEAVLSLRPQPGLTVVVGRNGSGKSSFAEGLELLLTGTTKRWESAAKPWLSAWQCLHSDEGARVSAELVVSGEQAPVRLQRTWEPDAGFTDASGATDAIETLDTRGWTEALTAFRPFLSYGELASMFDKLTSLYAALSPVLGLEDVDRLLVRLSDRRLALDNSAKAVKNAAKELAAQLDPDDPRQAELASLLVTRTIDPDKVRHHLDAHPPGMSANDAATAGLRARATRAVPDDEAIRAARLGLDEAEATRRALSRTDLDRARRLATLLEGALAVRDAGRLMEDCPVCGTTQVLDAEWDERARQEIAELRRQASVLDAATQQAASALRRWEAVLHQVDIATDGTLEEALAAAERIRQAAAAARAELQGLDEAWQTQVEAAMAWLRSAREAAARSGELKATKAAEAWLKQVADDLRNDRFRPIADQAVANWQQLRHDSNVELHDIRLKSVGRQRQASFDVRADGTQANALGVMSQGELLALSVSVFLPRAGLDESPFRFAVIDDPVQSMDPAKVDGLARILADAAKTRQVVVFTHDDRLPEAIRRLRLPATVLQVLRQRRSQVTVREVRSPLVQHLKDAKTMAKSDRLAEGVQQRVVPTLCRGAIEAACARGAGRAAGR